MDEADLLSELSAISSSHGAADSSRTAAKPSTMVEEVMAGLVRDYLRTKNLSAVEEFFNVERPPTRNAITDRGKLVDKLQIEKLVSKNKKDANYPSIAEVMAHYYFSSNITSTPSPSSKKSKKDKKKKKESKSEAKEDVESDMDSDEAAELAREAALAAAIKPDATFDDVSDQKVMLISSNVGRYKVGDAFSGGPTGDIHGRIVNFLAEDGSTAGPGTITIALTEARKTFALQSSNVGKYAPGMPFDNGAVQGFILKVKGSTNDGKNGPGQVVVALKPTTNTDTEITFARRSKLSKKPGDINGGDFTIDDVQESRILLMDHVGDVLVSNVQSADILVGPAKGCVRLKDCSKCNIVVACREIKIAKCDNIRVFLSTATPPVIGWGSKSVFLGPFTAAYPHLVEQFKAAELNPVHNCWRQAIDRDAEKKAKKKKGKSKGSDAPQFVLMDAQRTFEEEGEKFHIKLDSEPDAAVINPVPPDAQCIEEEAEAEKARAIAKVEAEEAAKAKAEADKKAKEEAEAAAKKAKEEEEAAAAEAAAKAKAEAEANAVPEVMKLTKSPTSLKAKPLGGPLGGLKKGGSTGRPDDDIAALIAAQKRAAKGEVEEEELTFETDSDDSNDSMELNMDFRDSVDEQRKKAVKAKQQAEFVRRNAEDEKRYAELKKLKENSVLNGAM